MQRKALLLGFGFLGEEIYNKFKKIGIEVEKTNRTSSPDTIQLDIQEISKTKKLIQTKKPQLVINCIGRNDIDYLEKNPKIANSVNGEGVAAIAESCENIGARLIHISTDSVFDGKKGMYVETDIPKPINVYAKSKLKGENEIKTRSSNHVIIRTNFYGLNKNGKYLLNSILEKLRKKKHFVGFDDVIFNPLPIENLAEQVLDISLSDYTGIIHLGSNTAISKYEFCTILAKFLDVDLSLIEKGYVDASNLTAKRPKNTSLDASFSKSIIKHDSTNFADWLQKSKKAFLDL